MILFSLLYSKTTIISVILFKGVDNREVTSACRTKPPEGCQLPKVLNCSSSCECCTCQWCSFRSRDCLLLRRQWPQYSPVERGLCLQERNHVRIPFHHPHLWFGQWSNVRFCWCRRCRLQLYYPMAQVLYNIWTLRPLQRKSGTVKAESSFISCFFEILLTFIVAFEDALIQKVVTFIVPMQISSSRCQMVNCC